ncbi:hypothetical protein [Sporosarcina aquimarina]|uniref:hypothetical protein n=1 Tax=Sporosarcina aquimarina TaxID=114975 RepID=UPI001C8E3840|nr:hypothetical protein [Sporosarcina aquimarina]MBY0221967.1 hypothetical protein [Sporosarcina aquimarina]
MNFKQKIILHNDGKYDLAGELISLALSDNVVDLKLSYKIVVYGDNLDKYRWRPKRTVAKELPEYFVAIALKSVLEKHAKKAYALRKGFEDDDEQIDTLYFQLLKMDMHYTVDMLDKITDGQLKQIEDDLGYWDSFEWFEIYEKWVAILPEINREKQKYYDEIVPLISESLNEVLPLVNLELDDKQLVKYIRVSTIRRTYTKLSKLLNSRTFRIKNEIYHVNDYKMSNENIKSLLKVKEELLTKGQVKFIDELIDLIVKEIELKNTDPFTFDKEGFIIGINKRYFADKMEINRDTFRQRLHRIEKVGG